MPDSTSSSTDTHLEATAIWATCAERIRRQVSDAVWKSTFSNTTAVAFARKTLVLRVPTTFQKIRIETRLSSLVSAAIDETMPGSSFRVEVDRQLAAVTYPNKETDSDPSGTSQTHTGTTTATTNTTITGTSTDPPPPDSSLAVASFDTISRLTFGQFVIGTSNRFAHAAALSVAEHPSQQYNPLFIHGESGLGKTHLLQAISHHRLHHYPMQKVKYVTCERFLNEFIKAIRNSTQTNFKEEYRMNSVLLVDDIQFLQDKEGLQEEFFHTFNDLTQNGNQIVLSSDRPPDAMPTLEGRLKSRFKAGLITDIQRPELETRLAILQKKAEWQSIRLPDSVLTFIATNVTESIRELEGALTKIVAYCGLTQERCTLNLAKQVLSDIIVSTSRAPVTLDLILEVSMTMFDLTREQITGSSRRRPLVFARQISMYVAREMTELSYPQIGRGFGNRDHTTVMYAFKKIEKGIHKDQELYNKVQQLQERVNQAR